MFMYSMFVSDKLSAILDQGDASKFADKLFDFMDGYRGSSRSGRSRKRKVLLIVIRTVPVTNMFDTAVQYKLLCWNNAVLLHNGARQVI